MSEKILEVERKFRNYSSDLLQASRPTFGNALSTFIDFCESDETMMTITASLKRDTRFDVDKSWKEMIATENVTLPAEEDERRSFLYQILLKVRNNKFDITAFGMGVFHDDDIDLMINHFNHTFSRPLVRALRDELSSLEIQGNAEIVEGTPIEGSTNTADNLSNQPSDSLVTKVVGILSPEKETEKIIADLADRYQKIGERWYQGRRYSRRVTISLYGFAASLTLTLFVITPSFVSFRLLFPTYVLGALALDIVILTFLAFFQSRWRKFKTDREERVFLTAYNLASELRQYPSPLPTSEASLDLNAIVEELESIWSLRFRLAKKTLSSLTDFIWNLREKLSPALAEGKTDNVKLSAWTLAKLCPLLIDENPELSVIEDMNGALSKLPERSNIVQTKLHLKIVEWVRTRSSVRWAAAISACVVVATVIFSVGVYLGYQREGFLAGTGGGIAIFVGYLNSLRLKKG